LNIRRPNGEVGVNAHYVPAEIKNGTLTAYYIKTTDKNIEKPLGRVNIKPYKKESELDQKDKQKCYFPDTRVYGSFPPDALYALKEWIISWQGDLTGDFYKWKGCYDYEGTSYHISVGHKMSIDEIEFEKGVYADEDEEEFDPWDDAPTYEPSDVYELFSDVEDFWDFLENNSNGHQDDVEVYEYEISPEYQGGGEFTVSDEGYLAFKTRELVMDAGDGIDFSWHHYGNFECRLQKIKDLTFKQFEFDDFVKFFPTQRWSVTCAISNSMTFEKCNFFLDADGKRIAVRSGDCEKNISYFNHLHIRDLDKIFIKGGDCTNALSILTIIKDLKILTGGTNPLSEINYITLEDINIDESASGDHDRLKEIISEFPSAVVKIDYVDED
jgi:hypothetical protein